MCVCMYVCLCVFVRVHTWVCEMCVCASAVLEAEDIDLYLRPLKKHIGVLEERSFIQLEPLMSPLFHTLCLIWTHSQCYCSPPRIVTLLQEFCNLLIEKVCVCLCECMYIYMCVCVCLYNLSTPPSPFLSLCLLVPLSSSLSLPPSLFMPLSSFT